MFAGPVFEAVSQLYLTVAKHKKVCVWGGGRGCCVGVGAFVVVSVFAFCSGDGGGEVP